MLIRQLVCETEIVPSLHSNRGGEVSATGAGFGAAACGGGGVLFCATGFCSQAQPVHESKISRAKPARIRVAFGSCSRDRSGRRLPCQSTSLLLRNTTVRLDSDMIGRRFHAGLTGNDVARTEVRWCEASG